jgi:hypothetical protein
VDLTSDILGRQDLTGQGTETCRRYSWSFKVGARYGGTGRDSSKSVNRKNEAVLARYDQGEAKCNFFKNRGLAGFVEASTFAQGSGETRRRGKSQRRDALAKNCYFGRN